MKKIILLALTALIMVGCECNTDAEIEEAEKIAMEWLVNGNIPERLNSAKPSRFLRTEKSSSLLSVQKQKKAS